MPAPIHEKAMPVILTTPAEIDLWLEAEMIEALTVQRPLADDALRIVAKGEKEGGALIEAQVILNTAVEILRVDSNRASSRV